MARRTIHRTIKRLRVTLANGQVAVRGQRAHGNTADGLAYATPSTITTLLPLGYFTEDFTGDGTRTTLVDLFDEVRVDAWANDDNPNDVTAADMFKTVYLKDEVTVSTLATNRSAAGRVLLIEDGLVYTQAALSNTGPTGAALGSVSGVADKDALEAVAAASRVDGMVVRVRADGSSWIFVAAASAAADEARELVIAPSAGTGRWLRADAACTLHLPIGFGTTDGAPILTVPTGFVLRLTGLPFWRVTASFTGGSSSTIGLSTSITGYTDKGDILGGASGDAAAALTAGIRAGTLGAELDDHVGFQALAFVAGDEIQFDRITDAFTAGAGFACVPVSITRL